MMVDRAPGYFRPFEDLAGVIFTYFPEEYEKFQLYYQDLKYRLRYLENILWRYKKEYSMFIEATNQSDNLTENKSTYTKKYYYEAQIEVGKKLMTSIELMNLDIDSFLIFARIVLDRVIYLLRPFYQPRLTKNFPNPYDIRKHIEWFENNPESVVDSVYADKLKSISPWFYNELRDPRNNIIVHPKKKHFVQAVATNGTIKRLYYVLETRGDNKVLIPSEITDMPNIFELMEKIMDFLTFINVHISEKLRAQGY